jgi:hypothetical protein
MPLTGKTEVLEENPVPLPLWLQQKPSEPAWDGGWASAVNVWKKSLSCNILLATVPVKQQSACSLSYDRSIASSKARSSASPFNFQYLLVYLMSFSSYWSLLSRLHVSSNFPAMTWIRRRFLRKMCSFLLVVLRFIANRTFFCSLTLYNTSALLTRLVQLILILLQHHISNLLKYFWSTFDVSNYQQPTMMCSESSISLLTQQSGDKIKRTSVKQLGYIKGMKRNQRTLILLPLNAQKSCYN